MIVLGWGCLGFLGQFYGDFMIVDYCILGLYSIFIVLKEYTFIVG